MKSPKVYIRSIFNQCIVCLQTTNNALGVCDSCYLDLPWLGNHCSICALPLPSEQTDLICGKCLKSSPPYTQIHSAFFYKFPIDHFIGKIKYNKKPQYIGALASLLIEHMVFPNTVEIIMPIPMHRSNLHKRGFNQSELLAKEISHHLGIGIDNRSLSKVKATSPQMGLDRKDRLKNQRNVFKCRKIPYKHILLIDDVMTTGATIEAASHELVKAGASQIHVIVIARTED